MKYLFASDLHGSRAAAEGVLARMAAEKADRLILLGDILYHGPRNDLPDEYAPKQVLAMLNERRDKIFCVRGNCDTEVDQMVLKFPMLADYAVLFLGGQTVYLTHGHVVNTQNPLAFRRGDILLHGHTHVPVCEDCGTYRYLNPGSVSIPKNDTPHSYMTWEDGTFLWRELESGAVYKSFQP